MREFLKKILGPFLTRLASRASAPDKKDVFASLGKLYKDLHRKKPLRGISIPVDITKSRFIIFSDHHKGNKDDGDDFASSEKNYLAAMKYYLNNDFCCVSLGDGEELWKYKPSEVIRNNTESLGAEAKFHEQKKYYKTFGNHDLTWKNKLDVDFWFKGIFQLPLPVYEGLVLKTTVNDKKISFFLTHGHQGDKMSDNNGFSTWVVSHAWRPLQRYLEINVNTPATNLDLTDKHNIMMYEWSALQKDVLLITGHTHKPVFASGLYSDHPSNRIPGHNENIAGTRTRKLKPTYFNSGCCCYNDADITGIEIANGKISLIRWHWVNDASQRFVLEEVELEKLVRDL